MKKIYLILLLLISNFVLIGQVTTPTKSELKKLFRKNIDQESRREITLSNPWVINNHNSNYFKSDTITLINSHFYQDKYDFCEVVNWSFYRKNKFLLTESQTCKEPSSAAISTENSFKKLAIKEEAIGLVLQIHNSNNQINRFLVLSILKTETRTEITLKRLV